MVTKIVILAIEILIFLVTLQRGYLLGILQNIDFPYYDLCMNFVDSFYLNHTFTPQNHLQSAGKGMWESFFSLLLYLFLYSLISKVTYIFWHVGRYERISPAGRLFSMVGEIITNLFLTAAAVGVVQQVILNRIYSGLNAHAVLKVILGIGAPLILIIVLFFIVGVPVLTYFAWVLLRVVISSSLKFIAIELFLMNAYYLLNIPGMMQETGTIVIATAGMIMCVGAVCGTLFIDKKADEYIEREGARGGLFGVF